jgi:hypothetical protein
VTSATSVPDLTLERYRLGELPPEERDAVKREASNDLSVQARLGGLADLDEALLAAHPPIAFVAAVERRVAIEAEAEPSPRPTRSLSAPAWMAMAAGAIVVAGLLQRGSPVEPRSRGDAQVQGGDRLKGDGPGLSIFVKREGGNEKLSEASLLHAGEVIQLAYRGAGRNYGIIISIDGRGQVTRHLPSDSSSAARLRPSGTVMLEHAYKLDDAPRMERFFFVTRDEPFLLEPILIAVHRPGFDALADPLMLDPSFAQTSFLLRKE